MVAVRVLVAQAVVVGVVPGEPASCAGEQGRVQHLPVVRRRVLIGREVGRDAELLEDDGLPEAARQLARERRGEQLAQLVVLHRVRMRAHEVDERREPPERVPVVRARHLDAPGAVAERDGVPGSGRPDGLDDDPRPGRDLLDRAGPAVQRHLVRDEPAADRRVVTEALCDLGREPGLLGDHPDVAVEIAPLPPGRVPVLAGHVADEERGDGPHPGVDVRVEEVPEARRRPPRRSSRGGGRSRARSRTSASRRGRALRAPRAPRGRRRRRSGPTCEGRPTATRSWRRARGATRRPRSSGRSARRSAASSPSPGSTSTPHSSAANHLHG